MGFTWFLHTSWARLRNRKDSARFRTTEKG